LRYSSHQEINYPHKEKYQSETLTFNRLEGVFVLLLVGLFISILLLFIENYINELENETDLWEIWEKEIQKFDVSSFLSAIDI